MVTSFFYRKISKPVKICLYATPAAAEWKNSILVPTYARSQVSSIKSTPLCSGFTTKHPDVNSFSFSPTSTRRFSPLGRATALQYATTCLGAAECCSHMPTALLEGGTLSTDPSTRQNLCLCWVCSCSDAHPPFNLTSVS